jgi:hypothetical protein
MRPPLTFSGAAARTLRPPPAQHLSEAGCQLPTDFVCSGLWDSCSIQVVPRRWSGTDGGWYWPSRTLSICATLAPPPERRIYSARGFRVSCPQISSTDSIRTPSRPAPAIIRALPEGMRDVLVEATGNALSPVFLTAALMARGGAARGAVPRGEAAAKASPDVNEKISFWCRRDQVSRGVPAYRARNVSTG